MKTFFAAKIEFQFQHALRVRALAAYHLLVN